MKICNGDAFNVVVPKTVTSCFNKNYLANINIIFQDKEHNSVNMVTLRDNFSFNVCHGLSSCEILIYQAPILVHLFLITSVALDKIKLVAN